MAKAIAKRDYYMVTPEGRRLFHMAIGPLAMSFVGASAKADLKQIRALHLEYARDWPSQWLRMRGLADVGQE